MVVGNWKMNKTNSETKDYIKQLKSLIKPADMKETSVALCVPFTAVSQTAELLSGTGIMVGAQNMCYENSGAYTGEISAAMLRDAGARCVILGYSERRRYYGETYEDINIKVLKALSEQLLPIISVGETLPERENYKTETVIRKQVAAILAGVPSDCLQDVIVAYEPVWAIGADKSATVAEVAGGVSDIRNILRELHGGFAAESVHILYGGSMNADNAKELLWRSNIDGGFIGRGSLNPAEFYSIIKTAGMA
jgi:triosephosphate isomerase